MSIVSFVSVYRRWRPKTFEEIIGQERITRTLQNAIRAGRTSHAYLFAGHRGTGKTTTARIFAKALNCAAGPTPTPDNTCPSCEAISRGVSMDVIEIDGASNTSVDDVRDLKEKIVLAPTESRHKVYIIDEVHMLSTSAFNALLKTLEEPPAHAVFILVTTEPHRIPPTVLSRCQRFDFRRVSFAEITGRLRAIAQAEGIAIEDEALALIVRNADGSVRDAESVLDQLSAYTDGRIDGDLVTSVLGLVDDETARGFATATLGRDIATTLRLAQEATDGGKDIRQVLRTLLEYFRDLLLVKTCGPAASQILDAPPERLAQLSKQVQSAGVSDLLRAVRVLNDAVTDSRWSAQPRLALEVALIRLARPEMDPSTEGLLARIERLEAEAVPAKSPGEPSPPAGRPAPTPVADASAPKTAPQAPAPQSRPTPTRRPSPRAQTQPDANGEGGGEAAAGLTIDDVRRQWARVLEDIKRTKMLCHALLIEGTPMEVNGNVLVVGLRSAYNFHVDNLNRAENREVVEGALSRVLGHAVRFHCQLYEASAEQAAPEAPARESGGAAGAAAHVMTTRMAASSGIESSFVTKAKELFGAEVIDDDGPAQ
ncbi:MAG: DNA polymerase III subunit gamma/tau [Armatimonadota bacterium]